MSSEVVDATFYHINSLSNGSPHDVLRRGAKIIVGAETTPFFRFFETYARTYAVRNTNDGTVRQVPAIEFLHGAKDGVITADNLGAAAYEVARHFVTLSRELVWESIRATEFSAKPSRQRCVWLIALPEHVPMWMRTMNFSPPTHWVLKVRATGRIHHADASLLAADSEPLPVWYDKARRYWLGEMTEQPHPEVLFEGVLTVEEILDASMFKLARAEADVPVA